MALTPIPSILDTAKFEHLALSALYQIASGGSSGGNVTITGSLPSGTNSIGSVNPDTTGSGSVTTSTPFVVTTTNFGTLAFQSNAVATGNVIIEASVDGTNFTATTYTALTTGNTSSAFSAATATIGQIDTSGFKSIRFRSYTIVGVVGITYNLSKCNSNVMLDNPLPVGSNIIGGTYSTPNVASGTFGSATVTTSGTITGLGATTRKYLQIQNIGTANPLYITTDGTTATATNGFVLQPNGGSVTWEGSFVPNGAITGFSTTTTCSFLWA